MRAARQSTARSVMRSRPEVTSALRFGRGGRHRALYTAAAMTNVLDGIRVIDFGRFIAGPYCAALLADLGADVIRVERRDGGEDRWVVPVTDDGIGSLFLQCNRGKRAITLDPVSPQGRQVTERLV